VHVRMRHARRGVGIRLRERHGALGRRREGKGQRGSRSGTRAITVPTTRPRPESTGTRPCAIAEVCTGGGYAVHLVFKWDWDWDSGFFGFVRAGFGAGGERLCSEWKAFGQWSVGDDAPVICVCGAACSGDTAEFIHFFFVLFFAKDRMRDAT
jgi:hypothetical protein